MQMWAQLQFGAGIQMWFVDADPGVGTVTAVALDPDVDGAPDVAVGADVVDTGAVVDPDAGVDPDAVVDPDVAAAAGWWCWLWEHGSAGTQGHKDVEWWDTGTRNWECRGTGMQGHGNAGT